MSKGTKQIRAGRISRLIVKYEERLEYLKGSLDENENTEYDTLTLVVEDLKEVIQ